MDATYFTIAKAGFVALTAICLALLLWGIHNTLLRMGWNAERANKRTLVLAAMFLAWVAFASVLALQGVLGNFSAMPPRLLLIILPPLVAVVWLMLSPSFSSFLAHVPAIWLIMLQVFRVPVEIFLWLQYEAGITPVQMTFEGQNWDVLTGLTAPFIAWICYGRGRNRRGLAIAWNFLGLTLLINIVATAILSTPSPFRVFLNEPANTVVAYFPVVFLPAVLVPLAYALHLFSLKKIFGSGGSLAAATPVHQVKVPVGSPKA